MSKNILQKVTEVSKTALKYMASPLRSGNIVMFHIGRSGSTVLGDLLDQHSSVYWDGEIYQSFYRAWESVTNRIQIWGARLKPIR